MSIFKIFGKNKNLDFYKNKYGEKNIDSINYLSKALVTLLDQLDKISFSISQISSYDLEERKKKQEEINDMIQIFNQVKKSFFSYLINNRDSLADLKDISDFYDSINLLNKDLPSYNPHVHEKILFPLIERFTKYFKNYLNLLNK